MMRAQCRARGPHGEVSVNSVNKICGLVALVGALFMCASAQAAVQYLELQDLNSRLAPSQSLGNGRYLMDTKPLKERLPAADLQFLFPGAEEAIPTPGRPPALEIKIGGKTIGYVFSTHEVVNATGYRGEPFDLVGAVDLEGNIKGVTLLEHHEAIIDRGVSSKLFAQFFAGFASASIADFHKVNPDLISGASVSGRMMALGVQNSARSIINAYVKGEAFRVITAPEVNRNNFIPFTNDELLANKSVVYVDVSNKQMTAAFEKAGGPGARPTYKPTNQSPDARFLNLYTALVTPPSIGANAMGDAPYRAAMDKQPAGGWTIWIGTDGPFSFASNSHFSKEANYTFDRFRIVQGGLTLHMTKDNYSMLRAIGSKMLFHEDTMAFYLPPSAGLDPLKPYQIMLQIPGTTAAGAAMTLDFPVTYDLPNVHKLFPPPPPPPVWLAAWERHNVQIAVLLTALAFVTILFIFQDALARRRTLYNVVRVGSLAFTTIWIGWYAGAQLSIVNVMSYLEAPFTHTGLATFMLDPLIFILAIYVAITLFVLGRGVFCGWLCPFGALQELLNKAAILMRIPQLKLPRTLQERLWAVKYLAAILLLGLAFYGSSYTDTVGEIEPFKTVISVKFAREWPFVLYGVVLLALGLFVERFYCRFLCPLGGTLAVFGRMHMFQWLKRKPQCGTSCRICETDCPVAAIEPTGAINMNECLQCLDCQVDYFDEQKCPPLIQRRKRREARGGDVGAEALGGFSPQPAE